MRRSPSLSFFFSPLPRPPPSTLFPYTTLFRSPQIRVERPAEIGIVHLRRLARERLADDADDAIDRARVGADGRSEEHTSELQSRFDLVCRLLLEKKKKKRKMSTR